MTRVSINKGLKYDDRSIAASMVYYPLVGTLLGLILLMINYIGALYLMLEKKYEGMTGDIYGGLMS
nr:hypothetical protein [Halonatronum saccharophilum]